MRVFSIFIIATMQLAACAVTPRLDAVPAAAVALAPDGVDGVVDEVVRRLVRSYSPASTRWTLRRPATDAFGLALVNKLRRAGYAVEEPVAARSASISAPQGRLLSYVFEPVDAGIYRLSLRVDQHALSRAYQAGNGSMVPAGAWSQGE